MKSDVFLVKITGREDDVSLCLRFEEWLERMKRS
jgi:hypothetical protein